MDRADEKINSMSSAFRKETESRSWTESFPLWVETEEVGGFDDILMGF